MLGLTLPALAGGRSNPSLERAAGASSSWGSRWDVLAHRRGRTISEGLRQWPVLWLGGADPDG